jgi:uncharacterized membrane protein
MTPQVLLTPFVLIAATLIGLGDVLYLSYYQYLNLIPSCALAGCEVVLSSEYSKFFGIPLSYFGLVYYIYALCLWILLAAEPRSQALRMAALGYSAVGFVLSAIFIFYIQLGLIGALCLYCVISALITTVLFGTSVWHFISTKKTLHA